MTITLGDKVIEAQLMEKEEAKEKYDDAVAIGKAVAILEEKKLFIELNIGNLMPG
jgi:Ca-activated chloride channel family protein